MKLWRARILLSEVCCCICAGGIALHRVQSIIEMPPKAKKFSSDQDMRLAYAVEKRPILWDATLDLYKRADLKPQVWEDVAKEVGPQFTGGDVQNRFKNLKDTFMRNLRKVEETHRSGAGTDDLYKPKWFLFSHLLFLKKSCIQTASSSNISTSISSEAIDSSHSSLDDSVQSSSCLTQLDKELSSSIYFDENLKECVTVLPGEGSMGSQSTSSCSWNVFSNPASPSLLPPRPASAPVPSLVPPRPASAPGPSGVKRPCQEDEQLFSKKGSSKKSGSSVMEEAVKAMKEISKQQPMPMTDMLHQDPEEVFGSFVATRLRGMEDSQKKLCENAIMVILMDF